MFFNIEVKNLKTLSNKKFFQHFDMNNNLLIKD